MLTLNWTSPSTRALAQGEVVSLRPTGHGVRISCLAGRLWVTVTGRYADTVVAAGEETWCSGGARIVVEALRNASVRVEPAARARAEHPLLSPQTAR